MVYKARQQLAAHRRTALSIHRNLWPSNFKTWEFPRGPLGKSGPGFSFQGPSFPFLPFGSKPSQILGASGLANLGNPRPGCPGRNPRAWNPSLVTTIRPPIWLTRNSGHQNGQPFVSGTWCGRPTSMTSRLQPAPMFPIIWTMVTAGIQL